MSATSCPATSSMTTNCGSFKPEERATRVAAGIPMRVTAVAAMMVAQARFATGIREIVNAHARTVANDPHVPGPGLRRPVPKNVATSVAQSGAAGRDAPATAGGTPALRSFVTGEGVGFTACLHRRDYLVGLLRRRLQLATKSRTRRWPTCRDQSGGSGRCKKESLRPWPSLASCRSGSGA